MQRGPLVFDVFDPAGKDEYANYLYIEACHRYLRCFLLPVDGTTRTLDHVITDAAYCILFFGFWRRDVARADEAQCTLQSNFITDQTFQDVLISCQMLICIIKLFRTRYPGVLFQPSRFSSRFSEYVFQMLRSATRTSNKVNALQALHIIRSAMHVLLAEADTDELIDMPHVEHKRGAPRGKACVDPGWRQAAPAGYYPTDDRITAALDRAYDQVRAALDEPLGLDAGGAQVEKHDSHGYYHIYLCTVS